MTGDRTSIWDALAASSASIYLVSGGLLVVYVSLLGYQTFVDRSLNLAEGEAAFIGPLGFAIGFVGLLGLYPKLSEGRPVLAGLGAILAGFGAVGWTVIAIGSLAAMAGVELPRVVQALSILGILGIFLGYTAFSIGIFRNNPDDKLLGLLLAEPPLLFVMLIFSSAAVGSTSLGAIVIGIGLMLTHLGIGLVLRTTDDADDEENQDATPPSTAT